MLPVYKIAVRDCNFYLNVTEAKWEIRNSKILRVYKIRYSKFLRVYKKQDFKIFCDSQILLVYKIAVHDCNVYVDVTVAKWEVYKFKLFAYFEAADLRQVTFMSVRLQFFSDNWSKCFTEKSFFNIFLGG